MSRASVEPNWPPRSPHEAFLSSPSGRNKQRRLQERLSPSPSPLKGRTLTPSFRERSRRLLHEEEDVDVGDEDEDDEETIQLQLQAIEARLKLKKLRQARAKAAAPGSDVEHDRERGSGNSSRAGSAADRERGGPRVGRLSKSKSQSDIQVPLSPPEKRTVTQEPKSPSRVLLGIDKGLKGRNVSLRRAPSLREENGRSQTAQGSSRELFCSNTFGGSLRSTNTTSTGLERQPKTFSERIAESRLSERERQEKQELLRKSRSKGFGLGENELKGLKAAAEAQERNVERDPPTTYGEREYTREEILQSLHGKHLHRGRTSSDLDAGLRRARTPATKNASNDSSARSQTPAFSKRLPTSESQPQSTPPSDPPSDLQPKASNDTTSSDPSLFESFSSLHLSKRLLPHKFLTRTLEGKSLFSIPDLLKIVKAPAYDAPDVPTDIVIFGTIASKSTPRSHKEDAHRTATHGEKSDSGRGKYMILKLTDLKWELDLFLFNTGFDRFWKLTPGTVIAVLNPTIMPPPAHKRDTGKFSLTLNSSDDTVLEIGTARDLGFCKSVKKDGQVCSQWIDKRHTEFCEFHVNLQLQKTKAGRMEVNTMTAPFAPGGRSASGNTWSRGRGAKAKDDGLKKEGPQHDRETHTAFFIAPGRSGGGGRTTASLLDDEDHDPDIFHRGTNKEERLRRRLAERERERDIARKLGESGTGGVGSTIGAEYLRASRGSGGSGDTANDDINSNPNEILGAARSRELMGVRATDVRLSPMKRKRALTSTSKSSSGAMGWSGAFRQDLLPMSPTKNTVERRSRSPAKTSGMVEGVAGDAQPPVRKKTRFVTAKGIREAGRESLGGLGGGASGINNHGNEDHDNHDGIDDDDDDDGLEIV
ncbi:MAG: hypothetical protein M1819_003919 [Sarea resinae]|nr:MAG: hypothetical protein M1819_003919 [Sarea resinae]